MFFPFFSEVGIEESKQLLVRLLTAFLVAHALGYVLFILCRVKEPILSPYPWRCFQWESYGMFQLEVKEIKKDKLIFLEHISLRIKTIFDDKLVKTSKYFTIAHYARNGRHESLSRNIGREGER